MFEALNEVPASLCDRQVVGLYSIHPGLTCKQKRALTRNQRKQTQPCVSATINREGIGVTCFHTTNTEQYTSNLYQPASPNH